MSTQRETNNNLLIRIDERTITLLEKVEKLEKRVDGTVSITEHIRMSEKITTLESEIDSIKDWRTRIVGIASGIAFVVGILTTLFTTTIKRMFGLE